MSPSSSKPLLDGQSVGLKVKILSIERPADPALDVAGRVIAIDTTITAIADVVRSSTRFSQRWMQSSR